MKNEPNFYQNLRSASAKPKSSKEAENQSEMRIMDRQRFLNPDTDCGLDQEVVSEKTSSSNSAQESHTNLHEPEALAQQLQHYAQTLEKKMQVEIQETRQRLEKSFEQRVATARNDFARELLAVFDNLDLTVQAAERGGTFENLVNGIKATQQLLQHALHHQGIERIDAIGQPFDPNQHEAIDTMEVSSEQTGLVVGQLRSGYRAAGHLLRPALVCVGRKKHE